MGIREKLAGMPKAGAIEPVEVKGLGVVGVRRLSTSEYLALPNEKTSMHGVVASVMDEGKPIFASIEDLESQVAAVGMALLTEFHKYNSIDVETAAKK